MIMFTFDFVFVPTDTPLTEERIVHQVRIHAADRFVQETAFVAVADMKAGALIVAVKRYGHPPNMQRFASPVEQVAFHGFALKHGVQKPEQQDNRRYDSNAKPEE
jgi:hypothetical protein